MFSVFIGLCTLLPTAILGSPRIRRGAELAAPPLVPLVHGGVGLGGALVGPVLYHAPNCSVIEKTITLKQCTPKSETICEDVEVPMDVIEYKEVCTNVTTVVCSPVQQVEQEIADSEVEVEDSSEEQIEDSDAKVKRSADPHHHLPYALPIHPLSVVYKTPCEEKVVEQCYNNPVVKTVSKTVPLCKTVTSVDCVDAEKKVPQTICSHSPHLVL